MMRPVFGILLIAFGSKSEETAKGKFSCENRPSGYYADLVSGCQIYHMCDGLGRQFSYSCPNATLFQQRMLICDHWYMVNCSTSEVDYRANLLIGQRDKPFVEDSEKHPYHRTPRPDLLSNPDIQEHNVIYRNGRSQFESEFNLVGVETDHENESSLVTDRPTYSLPSHWFTEFSKGSTTPRTEDKEFDLRRYKDTKNIQEYNENIKKNIEINRSKVKFFTNQGEKSASQKKYETIQVPVSSKHGFKTPLPFPLIATSAKEINSLAFSKLVSNIGNKNELTKNRDPENTQNMTPPSVVYQPPNYEFYDSTRKTSVSNLHKNSGFDEELIPSKSIGQQNDNGEKQWKDLRLLFLIPDYEFPLDSASRPGYENGHTSFEVNPIPSDSQRR